MKYDVADIFRKHIGAYKKTHRLSYEQHKAVSAIINCRTPTMGGVMKMCSVCKGLEAQKKWVLPIHYFQVVFTIDHVFNRLAAFNRKLIFDLFIKVAA